MKSTLLVILIFCAGITGAQNTSYNTMDRPDRGSDSGNRIQKGTVLTSGSFHYRGYSSNLTNYSSFKINVSAMLAMSPRFGIGLTTGYATENSEFESGSLTVNTTYNQFSIGPAFRAFGRMQWGWLQPFGQVDIPLSFGKSSIGQGNTQLSSFGIGVRPGLTAFLNRRLALETSLGIIEYTENMTSNRSFKSQTSNFNFGLGLDNVQFGILFLFNSF